MNSTSNSLIDYIPPFAVFLFIAPEGLVCVSPNDGESEDVEYEDWHD